MFGLIIDFLVDVLCYRIGRATMRLASRGHYRKSGSGWDGMCCALGGLVGLAALAALMISIAILQR